MTWAWAFAVTAVVATGFIAGLARQVRHWRAVSNASWDLTRKMLRSQEGEQWSRRHL